MYTNCPECGTVFRISTTELRAAEGQVRCGHCSATFNALATLVDEPDAAPATYVPLPASEETLEFDIPEDSWSNFFEGNAPVGLPESGSRPESMPETSTESGTESDESADTGESPPVETDVGSGIGSETVDQVGLYKALAAEAGNAPLDDEADWQSLLAEVGDDEDAPEPVYVISQEPAIPEPAILEPAIPESEPAIPDSVIPEPPIPEIVEPVWDDTPGSSTGAPGPLPRDFAADLPGDLETTSEPEFERALEPELHPEPLIADRPFLWTPEAAAPPRPGRHWGYTAGSALLALLLVMQVLHRQRDELATSPTLHDALTRTYGALGLPLWPAWDVRAFELRNSEAVADRSSPGALDILARIAVVGEERVGLPFVRVTLRDGLARPLGSRVFTPEEYLGKNPRPREPVSPGTLIPVEISLKDPGRDAQGFDVDVCVMSRRDGMSCRAEREPFLR